MKKYMSREYVMPQTPEQVITLRQHRPHLQTKKTRIMTGQINCHQSNWRCQEATFEVTFRLSNVVLLPNILEEKSCHNQQTALVRPYTFVIGIKRHMRTICLVQFLRWILSTTAPYLHPTPPSQRWKNIGIYQPWEHRGLRAWTSSCTFDSSGASNSFGPPWNWVWKHSNRKMEVKQSPPRKFPSLISRTRKSFGFSGLRFWEDCKINLVDFSPGNVRGALQKNRTPLTTQRNNFRFIPDLQSWYVPSIACWWDKFQRMHHIPSTKSGGVYKWWVSITHINPLRGRCRPFCLHTDARDWSIFHNHADGTKFLHHQWYNIKKTELPNYYDLKRCNLCFIVLGPPRPCHLQA